ncbi:GCN5-related N-acetyltransferase (modular protein) [Frankia canadensis]|uniref:GCN5-related N-acetyltransferase (Modular protein) n=1 Tax=Frankia canadensis TaxID=1836972 RepID=A0A2I2KNR1_9ACTN|nr:GNAT family N-acetyltransferase [Frankia canadensis]SNQ47315.1 GCN5-related N-acetyltransferase (modular protein) [Frankia canadensis]SOU54605.1 GCN5-related N-acetyltransferase (modular protein) [Frankia canadensis]
MCAEWVADVRLEYVAVEETFALRQRVLRPSLTVRDEVVGTGTVIREESPWGEAGWRLRWMATDVDHRRCGVGAQLLASLVMHVGAGGGGILWCNARLPAVPFYERAGFTVRGEPWDDRDAGPSVAMRHEAFDPVRHLRTWLPEGDDGQVAVDLRDSRIAEVCRRYGVAELSVFGSVARGDDTDSSDGDPLYVLAPGATLGFEIVDLRYENRVPQHRRARVLRRRLVHRVAHRHNRALRDSGMRPSAGRWLPHVRSGSPSCGWMIWSATWVRAG